MKNLLNYFVRKGAHFGCFLLTFIYWLLFIDWRYFGKDNLFCFNYFFSVAAFAEFADYLRIKWFMCSKYLFTLMWHKICVSYGYVDNEICWEFCVYSYRFVVVTGVMNMWRRILSLNFDDLDFLGKVMTFFCKLISFSLCYKVIVLGKYMFC